jgi:RNA polymerase sigma-70 factor (ECF subfamily)
MQCADTHASQSNGIHALNSNGAVEELRSILSSRQPSLYRSAYRLLGNAADAEDAVQDALLAAYKHLDQFEGRSQLSTWLNAIVQNSARMRLRTRMRHIHVSIDEPTGEDPESSLSNQLAHDAPSPEEECQESELNVYLRRLTTRLSPTLLRTYELRDIEGLSIRETAAILGIPKGTVKAQLARARRRLKQLMRGAIASRSAKVSATYRQDLAA